MDFDVPTLPTLPNLPALPTLESLDLACLLVGPTGEITWANESGRRLAEPVGWPLLVGRNLHDLTHPSSRAVLRALVELVGLRSRSEGTIQLVVPDPAAARHFHLVLRRSVPMPSGGRASILVQGWDVTALVQRQQELEIQAFRDSLTGATNRFAFMARLEQELELSRRSGCRVALLFADVDRFKSVNDTFGHETGDLVLAEIATRFSASLRPGDTLGRIGGDEFAAICPGAVGWPAVCGMVDRLRAVAAEPISLPAGVISVTVSIGAAFADEVDLRSGALLAQADARMFRAKASARE